MTVAKTVNLNEEEEEEGDSISQFAGLESARQSIPPLSLSLAGPERASQAEAAANHHQ